jgi:23S rRNA (cytosine1962-C5)-methyltransferase
VLQANTAWADRMTPEIVAALLAELPLRAVVARNDSPVREHEGLALDVALLHGADATAVVEEGGVRFDVDALSGQKTGWYFDQRGNRDRVAGLAHGARVLDVFSHVGAFGLRCAAAGALAVTLVDSSAPALELAQAAAAANGFGSVAVRRGDAFEAMAEAARAGEQYDIVVCDPPAFAKSKKDQAAGLRAYGRMARLAAALVVPGGFLFVASCSHHAPLEAFAAVVADGLWRARRGGRVLATTGAGPDHPVHPFLPESAYLKAQLLQLD